MYPMRCFVVAPPEHEREGESVTGSKLVITSDSDSDKVITVITLACSCIVSKSPQFQRFNIK